MTKRLSIYTTKTLAIILALTLAIGVQSYFVQNASAYYTSVQKGTYYYTGGIYNNFAAANYAATTWYGYDQNSVQTADKPSFYPAVESHSQELFYPAALKITVNAKYPDGTSMEGLRFGDLRVLASPTDPQGDYYEILGILYNELLSQDPTGISSLVQYSSGAPASGTNRDGYSAWGYYDYYSVPSFGFPSQDRGLRFAFYLDIDPTKTGTYKIEIHYQIFVYWMNLYGHALVGTVDLYDTIYYNYLKIGNPTATITSPSNNQEFGSTQDYKAVTVWVLASDSLLPISSVQIECNGGGWYDATYNGGNYWYKTYNLRTGLPAIGYTFQARATNTAGTTGYSGKITIWVKQLSGKCPNLLVWNGSEFVDEGVLGIHNFTDPERDVVVQHNLTTIPALNDYHMCTLKLAETGAGYNYSHSWIDQVKLFAIDSKGVWHPCRLVYAVHSSDGNVFRLLLRSDDKWTETYKGDEITLQFAAPRMSDIARFVFAIEGHNIK